MSSIATRVTSSGKTMQEQALDMRRKFPDRLPVFLAKAKSCTRLDVPEVDKNKYLAPKTLTVAELMAVVRKRIVVAPEVALFFMVKVGKQGVLLPSSMTIGEAYEQFVNDGTNFLELEYMGENTFG